VPLFSLQDWKCEIGFESCCLMNGHIGLLEIIAVPEAIADPSS
jgi:hypothetical protein